MAGLRIHPADERRVNRPATRGLSALQRYWIAAMIMVRPARKAARTKKVDVPGMAETQIAAGANAQPLTHRESVRIVLGCLLPVFMGAMVQTVVASALPTIADELGGKSLISWVITSYLVTSTATVPLYGKISDIHGRRVTLLAAIVIFLIGSVACALAPNMLALILARGLQGVGAGGLMSIPVTVLADVAPPKQRAKYYTYYSVVYIASGAMGPAMGGFFAEYLHWTVIFWFYVPFGLLALWVSNRQLKRLPRHDRPHELDILGAVLIVVASSSFMFILGAGGSDYAWNSPQIIGLSIVSAVFWIGFGWRLTRFREPLIPIGIIANPIVRAATIAHSFGWGAIVCLNIYLPLYLQSVLGMSPTQSGLALMILMVTVNSSALGCSQITARVRRYKLFPILAQIVCIAATIWLAVRSADMGVVEFQIVLGLIGAGFGPTAPVTTIAVQNAVPTHQLGIAVGTMSFVRGLLNAMMVAAFGVVALWGLGDPDLAGRGLRGAASALAADRDMVARSFYVMFLMTAGFFILALAALIAMEEKPLSDQRQRG